MRTLTPAAAPPNHSKKAVFATVLGNGLEWFDFTVYSFFSVIIARVFFPTESEAVSYLIALATFGVGFFMRPVGGIMIGIYADKVGRKAALTLTIASMSVGTLIIGLTPSYASIGLAAPLLIVVARLLQGFSAGGEMGSATAFLTEHAPPHRKTYYSSWIQASIGLAVLFGAGIGTLVTTVLSEESLYSWGWRVPFILGGCLIGPVAYYIRRQLHETPVFAQSEKVDAPLTEVYRHYPRETLTSFSMIILWTVCTYVLLFYMPAYASRILELPSWMGFSAGMIGGLMIFLVAPIVGHLSDRYGKKPFLLGSSMLILVLAYPLFALINFYPNFANLVVFQIVFGILIAGYTGPILAAFTDLFPAKVLSTGLSVAYNFAVAIFGGFAAFNITWLISATGSNMAPAFYVMIAAIISTYGCYLFQDKIHPKEA
ncbi:MAG: MFS transporter [Neisseriaceae bacterium]|nr:MFS transporter [Neisseriaceae bacterium]MBP6862200.1 MFS transporter [Neisseriaceae bacterium]